jgi:hypothetical protein
VTSVARETPAAPAAPAEGDVVKFKHDQSGPTWKVASVRQNGERLLSGPGPCRSLSTAHPEDLVVVQTAAMVEARRLAKKAARP